MAYVTAEQLKSIRAEIKKAFPKWKFSIRMHFKTKEISQ
jgi:hypothetical protein